MSESDSNNSVQSYELKIRANSRVGTNHLKLSLVMNFLLICGYSFLFVATWYEHMGENAVTYQFSILSTEIFNSTSVYITRTREFLVKECYDALSAEVCAQVSKMSTCFTVFLVFKILSVMCNLGCMSGLLYLVRNRRFDLYDVSVLT